MQNPGLVPTLRRPEEVAGTGVVDLAKGIDHPMVRSLKWHQLAPCIPTRSEVTTLTSFGFSHGLLGEGGPVLGLPRLQCRVPCHEDGIVRIPLGWQGLTGEEFNQC